jgi:hypothetical protein
MSPRRRMKLLVSMFCIGINANALYAQQEARNGTILGTVQDSSGKPVTSDIMLYLWSIADGRPNPAAMCSTQTNADGHYECHHLPVGKFVISAHSLAPVVPTSRPPIFSNPRTQASSAPPLSAAPQKSEPQAAYPITFYPDVTMVDSAAKITLTSNGIETANIIVRAVPVHDIHGALPSKPESPEIALKAQVGFFDLSTPFDLSYDALTGQFIFRSVPEGDYRIVADWATQTGAHHGETLIALSPTFNEKVKIEDQLVARIRGNLYYGSTPAPQLPSSVTISGKGISRRSYTVFVGSDGSFTIPNVIDGDYEVRVPHANGAYVQSIKVGGQNISSRQRLVVEGRSLDSLEIGLGTSTASISGVIDAEDVLPGKTGVVAQLVGGEQVLVALTDTQGRYSLKDLPPGDYELYAWNDLDEVEYHNPQYLKKFEDKTTTLTIHSDSPITGVNLRAMEDDR